MGTRFVCAEECIAHINFKKRLIEARDRATVATGYSIGHPVRCLENKMTRQVAAMEGAGASVVELEKFGEGRLQLGVLDGDVENGSLMAGQIAGLVKEIKPAAAIIKEIVEEAERVIARLNTSCLGVVHG